jgi:hypothetical protein
MKAKEYLRQIEKLDKCIEQKQIEYDELRHRAKTSGGIQYGERVQTSPTGDTLERKVVNYVQLEKEIDDMIDRFVDLKHQIIDEIQELSDVNYIDILFKRYVQYKSFEQIAVEMGYTYDYTRHLHGYALDAFRRKHLKVNTK